MKIILLSIFSILCMHTYIHGQTSRPLVHFMQNGPSPVNETQYGNNPKTGYYVKAGDARIYYELYGKGKTIVILHGGIFGSTYEMHQFIDSLSKKYQVIAVSTRGHGKSGLGTQPITYEQKAEDVMAVINAVTNENVVILGFSDGGYTGFKLASRYPGRITKLIAMGATELSPGLRDFNFDVKKGVALDSAYWKQQLTLMPEPQRLQEMFTLLGNMYSHLILNKTFFQTIQCPVLLLAGELDNANPPQRIIETAKMIPHSQFGIIPNSAHGIFLENFPAVWADLLPFLKE